MPRAVADAIVRLEEHNLRMDEHHLRVTERRLRMEEEAAETRARRPPRSGPPPTRWRGSRTPSTVSWPRRAPSGPRGPTPGRAQADERPPLSADGVLAAWRARLSITDDVWAVAVSLVPALVERGSVNHSIEALGARTGLSAARVHDCLRLLLKRQCIRQTGITAGGAPVHVLRHP